MRRLAARDAACLPLFPGMGDCLRQLARGGVVLAIVSSNSEATIRRVLGPELSALVTHWQCGAALFGKPRRLRAVLRRAGVPAWRAVLIGDEMRDIEAARAVGMASATVAWGYNTEGALRAAGPDLFFGRAAEIAPWMLGGSLAPGGQAGA